MSSQAKAAARWQFIGATVYTTARGDELAVLRKSLDVHGFERVFLVGEKNGVSKFHISIHLDHPILSVHWDVGFDPLAGGWTLCANKLLARYGCRLVESSDGTPKYAPHTLETPALRTYDIIGPWSRNVRVVHVGDPFALPLTPRTYDLGPTVHMEGVSALGKTSFREKLYPKTTNGTDLVDMYERAPGLCALTTLGVSAVYGTVKNAIDDAAGFLCDRSTILSPLVYEGVAASRMILPSDLPSRELIRGSTRVTWLDNEVSNEDLADRLLKRGGIEEPMTEAQAREYIMKQRVLFDYVATFYGMCKIKSPGLSLSVIKLQGRDMLSGYLDLTITE